MTFLYSVTLKVMALSSTLNRSGRTPTHDFVTSYIDHLKNTGSLTHTVLPNVGTFLT